MSENVIEVENITKTFCLNKQQNVFQRIKNKASNSKNKKIIAVDNVSFTIKKGEILGIIGLNGSGKSTLLQVIAGIYEPDSGKVVVRGSLAPILHLGTGFHPDLIASENIILNGMLLGFSKKEIKSKINHILEFAALTSFSSLKFKYYSSGMKARLGISTVFLINPDILLLDEILEVGDINFRKKCFESFTNFKNQGKTVLYVTHRVAALHEICERTILLNHGKCIMIDIIGSFFKVKLIQDQNK